MKQHARATLGASRPRLAGTPRSSQNAPSSLRPWLCATLLALLLGCRTRREPPPAIEREAERGPVRLELRIAPARCRVGDRLRAQLTLTLPEGFEPDLPDEQRLRPLLEAHGLELAELRFDPPYPTGPKRRLWRLRLALDVLRSGQVTLPALQARYRRSADADWTPIAVGPVRLTVTSALTTRDAVARPRDIRGPVVPPAPPWARAARTAVVGVLIVSATAAGALLWRRLHRPRPAPPVPPDVWARRALDALHCEDWHNPDAVRAYYYAISRIVRQYLERQFGVSAAEMTSEEFLAAVRDGRVVLGIDVPQLDTFLDACDRVKYAALHPSPDDARAVLLTAHRLIRQTAAAAKTPAMEPAT